jgi:hypothetical protein
MGGGGSTPSQDDLEQVKVELGLARIRRPFQIVAGLDARMVSFAGRWRLAPRYNAQDVFVATAAPSSISTIG